MKKQVYLIIAVIIAALYIITPAYAENERLEMNTEEYGSLAVIENNTVLNDASKYAEHVRYYENGQYIRYYNCSTIIALFAKNDNIEDAIADNQVNTCYMLINNQQFRKYEIRDNNTIVAGGWTVSDSDRDYIKNYVLDYNYVLRQLPESPDIKNIYYFTQSIPTYHDAIYLETSSGDYVMSREQEDGSVHLFTAEQFHKYAQDVNNYIMENQYDENGLPLYGVGIEELNPADYTSLSFREKTAVKWYHIVGGVVLAAVALSVIAFAGVRFKKRKKV